MRICYFGTYLKDYNRNRVIIRAFELKGHTVLFCGTRERGVRKYYILAKKFIAMRKQIDILFVAFPGHSVVLLTRLLTTKPIIFDAFVSQYMTSVIDRRKVNQYSIRALYLFFLDVVTSLISNRVLLDTDEQKKYYLKKFHANYTKLDVVHNGVDDALFYPREEKKNSDTLNILWYGYITPFHGLGLVIDAAEKLRNNHSLRFTILARDSDARRRIEDIVKRKGLEINFQDEIEYTSLPEKIAKADLILGVFGKSIKSDLVIPNKVVEAFAMKKPIITGDTKAIHELVNDKRMLVELGSSEKLASSIQNLANNKKDRDEIAELGYTIFKKKLTPQVLAVDIDAILQSVLSS